MLLILLLVLWKPTEYNLIDCHITGKCKVTTCTFLTDSSHFERNRPVDPMENFEKPKCPFFQNVGTRHVKFREKKIVFGNIS